MMTTYHIIHGGAVVSTSSGVPEVPGSNPRGGIFFSFFPHSANYHYTNNFYSGWSLGVAVPGICI